MISYEDGKWYVVTEDGHRLTGGCESRDEVLKEEVKCKYFIAVSDLKVEKRSWKIAPQIKKFPDYCACDPENNGYSESYRTGDLCYNCGKYVNLKVTFVGNE